MTGYSGAPKVTRGAIVGLDIFNPVASVTIFSYNPSTMTRSLTPNLAPANSPSQQPQGSRAVRVDQRLAGPPTETITLKVTIDATDQLETGDALAGATGIHPQLAALELLLYPKTIQVIARQLMEVVGTMEVAAPIAPLTLFIWGIKRVLPVQINSMSISETLYDPDLNPLRAEVSLSMRVMNYMDLGFSNAGSYVFMAHQVAKEVMGTISSINAIGGAVGGTFSF